MRFFLPGGSSVAHSYSLQRQKDQHLSLPFTFENFYKYHMLAMRLVQAPFSITGLLIYA